MVFSPNLIGTFQLFSSFFEAPALTIKILSNGFAYNRGLNYFCLLKFFSTDEHV